MAQVNRSFEFGDAPGGGKEWHKLMQREGYDLSKFELVAVPEEFSDASGTDQIGHGGLLEYDGVLDVEGSDTEEESCIDPAEGFNVTIEHVNDDLNNQGSGLVHLLEVPPNMSETKHYHKDDILDVGIEACDLKSLLEQFEESEQPQNPVVQKQDSASLPDPRLAPRPVPPPEPQPAPKEQTRYKIATPMKELPNPADVVKKIAPVKRKGAILLDPDALPLKKTKPKPVSQNPEVNKAIHLARSTHRASPIPFNLKNLIPVPKYLSMEHDYCMSPAALDKSNASDLSNQMSKEQRRAYYKYKYKVKKKLDGVDSPSKCSSVSSSPRSMSPASMSPNPTASEVSDGKVPNASMPNPPAPVPLFDKIPGYFSKKLLVGMYREIDSANPSKPVHQGYDQNIFVSNENSDGGRMDNPQFGRQSRPQVRRRHRRSYRDSRRKNSLSSQSDSSYCSSCSEHQSNPGDNDLECETRSRNPARHVRRRRRTRDSICSARSHGSRSPSYSRSRSPSYSSYSDCGSLRRSRSFSRSRSRSFSRSRSRSYSRSPSYSRSRSRSRSYSRSRSRSRSPRDYSRRSRSYSRSLSRSPHRTRRSSSRRLSRSSHSRSRTRSRARSRGRSRARSRSCHYNGSRNNNKRSDSRIRTFDPLGDDKEVKYTDEQLQEFEERRVVYVGNIENDTSRQDLMRQFSRFGPVDKIQLYFRDDMDNYGFVTFRYKCDAVAAITAGHDPNWPKYDLCFGGRRKFCMKKYEDLDSLNKASAELEFGYHGNGEKKEEVEEEPEESEFDKLLKAAMKSKNKRR